MTKCSLDRDHVAASSDQSRGPADLLLWLESALRRMIAEGGDADALELILKFARAE